MCKKFDVFEGLAACRYLLALFAATLFFCFNVSASHAETRSLKLYFLHTGEKETITFKRNGKYVQSGLKKINWFLRDWRRKEPTKMDPRLLDLIWEVYQETGSRNYIHVVSAYRSPATNNLLRKRGRGVARKSQHTLGKALDFFIPGVKLRTLRNIGLRKGLGGVGYYPRSGSPFVHMDTGNVRHWPKMSRKELVRVFPSGKTLHVPSDGKPLPRYNQAKAEYERKISGRGRVQIAKAEDIEKRPNFFAKLLNRDNEEEEAVVAVPSPVVRAATPPPPPPNENLFPTVPDAQNNVTSVTLASLPVPVAAPRSGQSQASDNLFAIFPEPETVDDAAAESIFGQVIKQEPVDTDRDSIFPIFPNIIPGSFDPTGSVEAETKLALLPGTNLSVDEVAIGGFSPKEIEELRQKVKGLNTNPSANRSGEISGPEYQPPVADTETSTEQQLASLNAPNNAIKPEIEPRAGTAQAAVLRQSQIKEPLLPSNVKKTSALNAPFGNPSEFALGTWALRAAEPIAQLGEVRQPGSSESTLLATQSSVINKGFVNVPLKPGINAFSAFE